MRLGPGGSSMQHDHAVSFYDHVHQVVATIADLVEDGLARDERVVVILQAPHAAELERSALAETGALAEARAQGRLIVLDAARTLSAFMVDGSPDPELFRLSVGGVIADAGADGTPVRAFGEMVALLWEQDNVAGALLLEELWNELAEEHAFSLLCAYPVRSMHGAALREVARVCALHSAVQGHASHADPRPARPDPDQVESAVFVPVPRAVAAARRFVSLVLESWDEPSLVDDAALVTSELATNAVRHAASPFRTIVARTGSGVRISIADLGPGAVTAGAADLADLNGRGVTIVEALASRWGCDPAPDGKVVWAELRA